jgi:hypothetical protein
MIRKSINNGIGQLAVAVDLKRWVLGRGRAEKITGDPDTQ